MKMITEASADEQFSRQLMKLQDAIETLEKMPDEFDRKGVKPVSTQITALEYASENLSALAKKMRQQRG